MYLRELQNPDVSFLYVLRMEDQIVGFCSFWLVLDEIHINNLAIRHAYQGQGLGHALLKEVLRAGAAGAERGTLEVAARTLREAALRTLGFEVARRVRITI
jgi:ribosomal-protein-alanine N-acetyltransferase